MIKGVVQREIFFTQYFHITIDYNPHLYIVSGSHQVFIGLSFVFHTGDFPSLIFNISGCPPLFDRIFDLCISQEKQEKEWNDKCGSVTTDYT